MIEGGIDWMVVAVCWWCVVCVWVVLAGPGSQAKCFPETLASQTLPKSSYGDWVSAVISLSSGPLAVSY